MMTDFYKIIICFVGSLLCSFFVAQHAKGQAPYQVGLPPIQNFTPKDYSANPVNYNLSQDSQGIIYVANGNGVLQFDGTNWRKTKIPNGFAFAVGCTPDGRVYVGGSGELGHLVPDAVGRDTFQSLVEKIPSNFRDFSSCFKIEVFGPHVFFLTTNYLFRWRMDNSEEQMKVWPLKNIYHFSDKVEEELFLWEWQVGLQKIKGDSLVLVPEGENVANVTIGRIVPLSDSLGTSLMGLPQAKGFGFLNETLTGVSYDNALENFLYTYSLTDILALQNGLLAFGTAQGGVAIADQDFNLLQVFDKTNGLVDNSINTLFEDKEGGLWVSTFNGLSRIEISSPFTHYKDVLGLEGNIRGLIRKQENLYAYGYNGFFELSAPGPDDFRTSFKKRMLESSDETFYSIIALEDQILSANFGFLAQYQLDAFFNGSTKSEVIANLQTTELLPSRFDQGRVYAVMGTSIGILSKGPKDWKLVGQIDGFPDGIQKIVEQAPNHLWANSSSYVFDIKIEENTSNIPSLSSDSVQSISGTFETFGVEQGLPKGVYSLNLIDGQAIFCTLEGLQKYNPSTKRIEPALSLPLNDTTRAVLRLEVSESGDLWWINQGEYASELIHLKPEPNGTYSTKATSFQAYIKEGITVYNLQLDPLDPDVAWISTSDGLVKYQQGEALQKDSPFPALVRSVLLNGDSLLFAGSALPEKAPALKYAFNSIRFEYAALSYDYPKDTRYQVRLEGFDDEWLAWTDETTKDYTNLPEGKYTFRVRAESCTGEKSEEGQYSFSILPPWYRSWWAYASYLLLSIAAVYSLLRWRVGQLNQRNLVLEKQVKERTLVIEEQKDRLEELNQVQSRFFTNISHELRTPLTVIGGVTNSIEGNEKAKELILRNNNQILKLVNEILDLRKLETGVLQLNLIQGDIVFYLRFLFESFQSLAESKGIELRFLSKEREVMMDYDPAKLLQVISNLLSNAIKFTPEGGEVNLRLATRQSQTPSLMIEIADSGIGIPENKLPFIFDRFYQVDASHTRQGEGAGIGLALTKELVKLMMGSIEVKSTLGKGSTFELILPISRNAAIEPNKEIYLLENASIPTKVSKASLSDLQAQKQVTASMDQYLGPKEVLRLLIIEDNQDLADYMENLLGDTYELSIARDGQEGIDMALSQVPDLIISDVMMPKKDGFEVCKTLKKDQRTSHIPIILLTAKADMDSKLVGLKGGADAYLTKPFNEEELIVRLEKLHELRAALRARYSGLEVLSSSSPSLEDAFISSLNEAIENHLSDESFSVTDLCKEIGMSRTQLHMKIKALTNRSTTSYIRIIRLKRSKTLLLEGKLNISQVALEVGFQDRSYFTRTFKKEFGISPKEYIDSQ